MFPLVFGGCESGSCFLGGEALIDVGLWPVSDEGAPMVPLLTITNELFLIPTLNENQCVTVFAPLRRDGVSISATRKMCVNDSSQLEEASRVGLKAVLHEKVSSNSSAAGHVLPKIFIARRDATLMEQKEEIDGVGGAFFGSKLFGSPAWLQDPIDLPPKYAFTLQLSEQDLRASSPSYDGLFRDGLLYLFLRQGLKRGKVGENAGVAFIQFT